MATSQEQLSLPAKSEVSKFLGAIRPKLLSGSPSTIPRSPSVGTGREQLSSVGRSATPDLKTSMAKSPSLSFSRRPVFDLSSSIGTPNAFRKQMTIETDRIQRQQTENDLTINQYTVGEIIGQGSFGLVRKAIHENGTEYAMKIVSKRRMRRHSLFTGTPPRRRSMTPQKSDSKLDGSASPRMGLSTPRSPLANVYREIAILKKLNHPHIVQLVEVLDDPLEDEIILVFEYLERGSLMNLPVDTKFSEDECREYFIDLILGLEYLHSNKVIHRDIKPSNLLLGNDGQIKISDFGVSEEFEDDDVTLSHTAGTPAFMAPETLDVTKRHFKGKASDIWSSGVTLYAMVFGQLPFVSNSITELHEKIRTEGVRFPEDVPISPEMADLMTRLLEKCPEQRIDIPEIREHPWVRKSGRVLICREENCGKSIEVDEKEVKAAVTKSYYPIHVLILIKKMAKQKSFRNPFSSPRRGSTSPTPSPTPSSPTLKVPSAAEARRKFATKQNPTIEISQYDDTK